MITFTATKRVLEDVYTASSVEEALAYLRAHHGNAQLIAGGTHLMPQVQRDEALVSRLVDVSRVGSIKRVSTEDGQVIIGGATTFKMLVDKAVIREQVPLLNQAARAMGTPQVRQLATLAGNLVAAEGNAEALVALVALDADVQITNFTGRQWLPMDTLLVRPGVSRVDSTAEIITGIRVPAHQSGQGVALARIVTGEDHARSPFILALILALDDQHTIEWASVTVGVPEQVPGHLIAVERALAGLLVPNPNSTETFVGEMTQALEDRFDGELSAHRIRGIGALAAGAFDRAVQMALAGA